MNNSEIIVRRSNDPFKRVKVHAIEDTRLSHKAVGLLARLLVKPEKWTISMVNLQKTYKGGRDLVRSAMKELKDCGYAELIYLHDENGNISGSRWVVTDTPMNGTEPELPTGLDKARDGKPVPRDPRETDFPTVGFYDGRVNRRPENPSINNINNIDKRQSEKTTGSNARVRACENKSETPNTEPEKFKPRQELSPSEMAEWFKAKIIADGNGYFGSQVATLRSEFKTDVFPIIKDVLNSYAENDQWANLMVPTPGQATTRYINKVLARAKTFLKHRAKDGNRDRVGEAAPAGYDRQLA
jgi:hypothetical protein